MKFWVLLLLWGCIQTTQRMMTLLLETLIWKMTVVVSFTWMRYLMLGHYFSQLFGLLKCWIYLIVWSSIQVISTMGLLLGTLILANCWSIALEMWRTESWSWSISRYGWNKHQPRSFPWSFFLFHFYWGIIN